MLNGPRSRPSTVAGTAGNNAYNCWNRAINIDPNAGNGTQTAKDSKVLRCMRKTGGLEAECPEYKNQYMHEATCVMQARVTKTEHRQTNLLTSEVRITSRIQVLKDGHALTGSHIRKRASETAQAGVTPHQTCGAHS